MPVFDDVVMTEHDVEALSTRPRPASLPMEVLQNALDGVPLRRHPATYDPELDDAVHANLLAHTWYADTSQFYLLTRDVTDYELSFWRPEVKLFFGQGLLHSFLSLCLLRIFHDISL